MGHRLCERAEPGSFLPCAALGLLVGLLGGCSAEVERADARPNVLMVLVDTCRADQLGCYGNEQGLTPAIDALAAEGALFEQCSAHAPWTLPSTASLLTSLHPDQHGAGGNLPRFRALGADVETLPERFLRAGWRTHSIVNVAFLGELFGLTRGFEETDAEYSTNNQEMRRADAVTDAALAWIDEQGAAPFFLLVHYFDPHAVYDPPQPFRRRHAAPQDREDDAWVFGTREHMMALRAGKLEVTPPIVRRARRLYDGEVAWTDAQVGRLLDGLDARALAGSTIVVLTVDHGEEFLDHGGFEHGHTLYAELVHAPLVVRWPGRVAPRRIASSVRHVDVAPTLCELADVAPGVHWAGVSLVPLLRGEPGTDRPVLAHGNFWGRPLTSWRDAEFKLVLPGKKGAAPQLYRWREDPGETSDLAGELPDVVARLRADLEAFQRAEAERWESEGRDLELSPERLDELRGLGYVGDDE